jgi:hypothetical protein
MRGNTTVLSSSVAVTIAVLAVAGCTGQTPATTTASGSAGTASSSGTAATTSASPAPTSTPNPPSGTGWVDAPTTGVRFPVPEGWQALSFRELLDSGDKAAIAEAAETMGVTEDQLDALAEQIEVIAFGPTVKEFAVNINAVPQPGTAMPSAEEASSQLEQIGGTIGTPVTGTTDFGKSLVVPYTLKVKDVTVQGRSILLETPDGVATLTVSHVSEVEADRLTKTILDNVSTL